MIFTIYKIVNHQKKTSTILSYGIKFLSSQALLMNTVYALPLFNMFIAAIICSTDSIYTQNISCYSGIYYLHLIIAFLGMILSIILSFIFSYLFIDLNPASNIPFSQPQSMMPLLKLGLKLLCPLYVTLDYNGKIVKAYIVLLNIFNLFILFYRFMTPPYFSMKIQSFIIFCESFLFWVSLCSLITTFLDSGTTDNIGLLYLAICLPMLWNVYRTIVNYRQNFYIQLSVKEFKIDQEVEIYILILIKLIEDRENADSRIKLEGILKYHSKFCPKDTCFCRQLLLDESKEEEALMMSRKWYLFIQSILVDSIEKFPKSARLHLLYSYILHEKLKNKFKALFELMIAKENNPNVKEEFSIFRFANQIEEQIKESDERAGDSRVVDVNKIVLFQKRFIEFQNGIDKSVQLHLDFWRELVEDNPEIQKIENMGSKITSTVEYVRESFAKLREIYSNHIKCLEIYGYFLKDIVNDDIEGEKILDNVKYAKNSQNVNKQFVDQDRLKYGENSNTAILTVSGNYGEIGIVTNLNNEIQRILGWSKIDVMEQNISRIMPKVYADIHDHLMESYLQTSEVRVIGVERTVLCLNKVNLLNPMIIYSFSHFRIKNQYLVPCTLMVKVLPNLEEGIQIVGFLKDIEIGGQSMTNSRSSPGEEEQVHYMIYRIDNESYTLQGVTESCYTSFGIPAQLMYGNNTNNVEFTVDTICPELLNPDHYDELKSPAGFRLTLDTTSVQNNFLLDAEDDEESQYNINPITINASGVRNVNNSGIVDYNNANNSEQENESNNLQKKSKYKKVDIRAQIIEEQSLEDRKLVIVKFVEVDDTDDGKSKANQEIQGSIIDQNNQRDYERNQMIKKQMKLQQLQSQQQQQQQHDEEFNASEGGSNISTQSVNDEVRQLKDFKSLISEKTVPKSITILKRTVISLMLIIIILASIELAFRIEEEGSTMTGVQSIFTSYRRTDIMADINFYTRRISNLAKQLLIAYSSYFIYLSLLSSLRLPSSGNTQNSEFLSNQNSLAENVDLLQTNQFSNMKDLISVSGSTYTKLQTALYEIKFQQQTRNDIKTYTNLLTDAMVQFITSSSSLANSTITTFVDDTSSQYVDSTLKNFYYVISNGLFVLRSGGEFEQEQFYNFYYDKMESYETSFRIVMILGIFFILLSLVMLIPYVFKVHKTNNRVLSLFGMIPIAEIKLLAEKCEVYSVQFIDDKKNGEGIDTMNQNKEQQELLNSQGKALNGNASNKEDDNEQKGFHLEIDGENEEQRLTEGDQNIKSQLPTSQQQIRDIKNSENYNINELKLPNTIKINGSEIKGQGSELKNSEIKSQQSKIQLGGGGSDTKIGLSGTNSQLPPQLQLQSQSKIQDKNKKIDIKDNNKKTKKGEEEETDNVRTLKLMNAKDNNRKKIVAQFVLFSLLFATYFVVGFVLELQFLSDMQQILEHLKYVSQRSAIIKYVLVFMVEQISTDKIQYQDGENYLLKFINLSYDIENLINSSSLLTYPSQFNNYFSYFSTANYGNFCPIFPSTITLTTDQCLTVNQKMLQKGLKVSVTAYVEDIRNMITEYTNSADTSKAAKNALFQRTKFTDLEQMQFYMVPMIEYLNDQLMKGIQSYLDNQDLIEEIKFGVFLTLIIIIFVGVWIPYLKQLSQKIWKTKGMLNMIPMDIITRDQNLKQAFVSGDILQAVK